ncbi:MarR family transcriptional regulator [Enterococcus mundtii]|uniref:MarR family transcriptional regulator n=1 Tax=Enterococcus mundtii TaxID=53346 RepID=UPI001A9798DD|nr:MarR family transcriptional regulator [Enterococcus mundtii]MBO1087129.1 MarR family transcriptional regulator [Enterococcus mundtii]
MIDEMMANMAEDEPLKVSVLREELVMLTKDSNKAIVLNQFIYWSERTKSASNFVKEEMTRLKQYTENGDESVLAYLAADLKQGWIYKSATDLIEDTMLTISKATMTRIINDLLEKKWILKRKNPRYKGDNTPQYRVNLLQLQIDLYSIGYSLNGYRLISNFVDFAKIQDLKKKLQEGSGEKETNQENGAIEPSDTNSFQNETGSTQNETGSLQNETTPIQNEITSPQFETSTLQNDTTLPEITTEVTPENTSEKFLEEDDEKNNKENTPTSNNDILKKLLELTGTNKDYQRLLIALRKLGVQPMQIYKILMYFSENPNNFDKEVIKQQLTWMANKSQTEYGISSFGTYFINGINDRLQAKNINEIDYAEFDKLLGIENDLPKVSLHNWLEDM